MYGTYFKRRLNKGALLPKHAAIATTDTIYVLNMPKPIYTKYAKMSFAKFCTFTKRAKLKSTKSIFKQILILRLPNLDKFF